MAAAMPTAQLLGDSRFWRLAVAAGLYNSVIIMFSTQVVPFATGLGIDATRAAGLLTIYLVGTLVGTPLVGAAADRIGGARLIALLCLALALWQGLIAAEPGFIGLALLAGLSGLQGSAMIPALGLALSRHFGPASFAKALGIATLVGLPFGVASVPLTSWMFVRTHSYTGAFLLAVAILALGAVLTMTLRERSSLQASAV
jgi:MFS family permease